MDVYDFSRVSYYGKITQKSFFFHVDKKDKTGVNSNQ